MSSRVFDLKDKGACVVGAGLAGSLLAIVLAKRGMNVHLIERRADMRKEVTDRGRSINLALSERGINALKHSDIIEKIMGIAIPMKGRLVHPLDGEVNFQPYSTSGQLAINSISRQDLNKLLLDRAQELGVQMYFEYRVKEIDNKKGVVKATKIQRSTEAHDEQVVEWHNGPIFGSDGAFSACRMSMLYMPHFDYSQHYSSHGYKELEIPPGPNGTHQLDKNGLHIWPRGQFMMIALPNLDGSFTVTLFYDMAGFAALDTKEKVLEFFNKEFPDATKLMPALAEDFFANPTGNLLTVKCYPWSVEGKLTLLGDACHAVVPFFGQGMNCAFEDVRVLSEIIDEHGVGQWREIFAQYQASRKPNADAIADMALQNYIEMRDKVADKTFLFHKKVEALLGKSFPDTYRTRYELVSFTNEPYTEAVRRGEINQKIIDQLTAHIADYDTAKVDLDLAKKLIDEHYKH
jgi:kynurenine 3-monooxygenase